MKRYYVYIITNIQKNVLYVGVTNNWKKRIKEHIADAANKKVSFAGRYNCSYLLLQEEFMFINDAIARGNRNKRMEKREKGTIDYGFKSGMAVFE